MQVRDARKVIELRPPRYLPERLVPERAFIPGRTPKPATEAQPASYLAAEQWRDNKAYLWGVDLFNHGFAWEAHEAWEGLWRAGKHDQTQATFLQGLIQCAAARVKASMHDEDAAQRLRDRGLARLSRVREQRGDRYMGLDLGRYLSEHTSGRTPMLWLSAS
jgi:hypothetical protein